MDVPFRRHAVLVPVKSFRNAKLRLAGVLPAAARSALAQAMAEHVIAACGRSPVAVVHDDPDVALWAERLGAIAVAGPPHDLDAAVTAGVRRLADAGFSRVTVCHADLPRARGLDRFASFTGVAVVPDRHRSGTNVISLPARSGLRFQYGPRSFERHLAEARRLGTDVHVVDDPLLADDVDVPADLARIPNWLALRLPRDGTGNDGSIPVAAPRS